MSCCTTTVPNSARNNAPVGHTSRHFACVRCLHISELISHRKSVRDSAPVASSGRRSNFGMPISTGVVPNSPPPRAVCLIADATVSACPLDQRDVPPRFAPSMPVLSNDIPSRLDPSSGTPCHSLDATRHALQPMHTEVSVKKPTRGGCSSYPASRAGSSNGPCCRGRIAPAADRARIVSHPPLIRRHRHPASVCRLKLRHVRLRRMSVLTSAPGSLATPPRDVPSIPLHPIAISVLGIGLLSSSTG